MITGTEETCEACGYASHLGAVAQHHLIPKSVTQQAGMPDSPMVDLCNNCHFELHNWYKMKVTNILYDSRAKEFRDRSREEKIKEYESAFRTFKKYKHERRKIRGEKSEEKNPLRKAG